METAVLTPPILSRDPVSPPPPAHSGRWLVWLGAVLAVPCIVVGLVALLVWNSLHLSRETRSVRDSLVAAVGGDCQRRVEVRVGWWVGSLARLAGQFVDLPPEARAGLRAFRSGEVGVYDLSRTAPAKGRGAALAAADAAMERRGWDRVVGVVEGDQVVAVYVSARARDTSHLGFCVAVLDDSQMVVASVRGNPQPLLELVRHDLLAQLR